MLRFKIQWREIQGERGRVEVQKLEDQGRERGKEVREHISLKMKEQGRERERSRRTHLTEDERARERERYRVKERRERERVLGEN